MHIIDRGRHFVEQLRQTDRDDFWRECPHCGSGITIKYGFYTRRPWFLGGRKQVRVQRHLCRECDRTYSEIPVLLVRGSWYAREVHRFAVDRWQHGRSSLRRVAELVRSLAGHQERWFLWHPLATRSTSADRCTLSASTVHRWLDRAGRVAQEQLAGLMEGLPCSGHVGADGLWAKLREGAERVVLVLEDSVSGLLWPPLVAEQEGFEAWKALVERAEEAGLKTGSLRGLTSDGSWGMQEYMQWVLVHVDHQRCIWHLWRNLRPLFAAAARQAAAGVEGKAAKEQVRAETCEALGERVHAVLDAATLAEGQRALAQLDAHPQGEELAAFLAKRLQVALAHTRKGQEGLGRVSPEWCWRNFRQRLSRGRNHGSAQRLERAALVWAIYHNFTPTQSRKERKRHYRHPGQSSLQASGVSPGLVSYLDALRV